MKRNGIINGALADALATLRHTDLFLISDGGFPSGPRDRVIDLGLVPGLPRFGDVLLPVLKEVAIEAAWIASESAAANPDQAALLARALPSAEAVPHDELKRRADSARFIVRTGDATPYANVLLRAGYPF